MEGLLFALNIEINPGMLKREPSNERKDIVVKWGKSRRTREFQPACVAGRSFPTMDRRACAPKNERGPKTWGRGLGWTKCKMDKDS